MRFCRNESTKALDSRQPIAVSDISVYICLIDIRSIQKQIQRTTEWEASRLVYSWLAFYKSSVYHLGCCYNGQDPTFVWQCKSSAGVSNELRSFLCAFKSRAGLSCVPRVWRRHRLRVHVAPHGEDHRQLWQDGQAWIRHLPFASGSKE